MRWVTRLFPAPPGSFNPRPVFRPGDATNQTMSRHVTPCFNPRPVFRPGDANLGTVDTSLFTKFQSAPGF